MQGNLLPYFVCANSAHGFINYFPAALSGLRRVYILKGGPGTGKSTLMKKISSHFRAQGEPTEHILCSSDPASLDGVLLPKRGVAVVDGTAPHIIEPTAPGAIEEYCNLGIFWDAQKLMPHAEEILSLNAQTKRRYHEFYSALEKAKETHDRLEKIYNENTDFSALNLLTEDLTEKLFSKFPKNSSSGQERHRFCSALTPSGTVSYVEPMTLACKTRIFLKGRPGIGKSTLLCKLAAAAIERGIDTELYHCNLDPNCLNMVIFRPLQLCIFDATSPQELFPSRESDILLDLYATAIRAGTESENHETLRFLSRMYQEKLRDAQALLGDARALHDELEKLYTPTMDFSKANIFTNELIQNIEALF